MGVDRGAGGMRQWTGGKSQQAVQPIDPTHHNSAQGVSYMSKEPKYRPYLTLPEIKSLITLIEESQEVSLNSVLTTLKLLTIKAESGMIGSSYVPTGNKPGPTSKVDIIKADISSEYDKQRKEMPYGQALAAAETYGALGMPVPQDIQSIIDAGDTNHDSHN